MPKAIPIETIVGCKYGRWTVSEEAAKKNGLRQFLCRCDCGSVSVVGLRSLMSGNSKSCGCYNKDRIVEYFTTHGEGSSKQGITPEYRTWSEIKKRCCSSRPLYKKYYLEKGISVCREWLNNYEQFLSDMGRKPTPKHSIDRIDNSKGYSKDNCRWATMSEQNNNRTSSRVLTYRGISKTMMEWAIELKVNYFTLRTRLHDGWTVERAFETPMNGVNQIDRTRGSSGVHRLA